MADPIIRGLTLWRPWPASILLGPKRVENRPWCHPESFPVGSVLAIHSGARWQQDAVQFIQELWPDLKDDEEAHRAGEIQGLAQVTGYRRPTLAEEVKTGGNPWAFGPWVWELGRVVPLLVPIPMKGAQGLWTLPLPIERQLRETWRAAA